MLRWSKKTRSQEEDPTQLQPQGQKNEKFHYKSTHCTGVLPTLFTPLLGSPRTSSWLFLSSSSSSPQFVFSEPLRFEHQLRSQLLCSKLVSRSINRQQTLVSKYQTSFNSIDQGSTKQDNNKTGQDPSEGMALGVSQ